MRAGIRKGDWVILRPVLRERGGPKCVWYVREVMDEAKSNELYGSHRFFADLHSGAGVTGANLRVRDYRRATQREMLASEGFVVGFQRVCKEKGDDLVAAPWA